MQEASKKASNRKEAAASFLKLAASGNLDEAYGNYIGANFRHHNPYFPGDAESLKAWLARNSSVSGAALGCVVWATQSEARKRSKLVTRKII